MLFVLLIKNMINFDSLILKLFERENADFFIGAKIQKIQQPNRNELIFFIRNNKEQRKFYINFNPNYYHLCFMSDDNEKKRNISIPKTAPMFCMLLRKYILNAKIVKVCVPKFERIFEIYFEYYDELNEKTMLCLAIELMGKHSNVILYNYDTNVIIGCAHNVSSEKSRERELAGLLPYVYPPKQKKKDILKVSFESFENDTNGNDFEQNISKKYGYITQVLIKQVIEKLNTDNHLIIFEFLKKLMTFSDYIPSINKNFSEFSVLNLDNWQLFNNVNEMIDAYFAYNQMIFIKENLRLKIIKLIESQLKKLKTLKEKQQAQIEKIEAGEIYKQKADILMANSYFIKSGQKGVNLKDFSGEDIFIALDENLSVTENANKYYALYKKMKSSNEHASSLIKETLSQILYCEENLYYAQNASDIGELNEIEAEINTDNKIFNSETTEKVDFIEYLGYKIYAGKNKKQNDYILSKIAHSEDLWFHPLNAAGAHVLIKVNNKSEQVPDNVLLKAAQITKEFSSQKNNSKTAIIFTKRKYVAKANKKMAFVTYKNETEIIV